MQETPINELPDTRDHEQEETAQPQQKLSRRKRGVGPVLGMSCESGYKLIGDDCILANVPFD